MDGDDIDCHFEFKEVGATNETKGTPHNRNFHMFAMKEPGHTMKLMSTCETLEWIGKEWDCPGTSFKCPKVVHNHCQHRDAVDDHNGFRMCPTAMEESWKTTCWPNHVFLFPLLVAKVNVWFADSKFFGDPATLVTGFLQVCQSSHSQSSPHICRKQWKTNFPLNEAQT